MMRKAVLFTLLVVFVGLYSTIGHGHSNSAPTFDCITCHPGEVDPNIVKVEGLPKAYTPGKTYTMTVVITGGPKSEGEFAGGFALEATGGEIIVADKKNTQISEKLLTHTQEGSSLRKWTFKWKAPAKKGEVGINVMAVAANGDFSSAGDVVGIADYTIKPSR